MPKREGKGPARITLTVSVSPDEKVLWEEEASKAKQTVSAFVTAAVGYLIAAPKFGGTPIMPTAGYMVLPTGLDEHIFVPRNWGAEELRRAAKFYEGLTAPLEALKA